MDWLEAVAPEIQARIARYSANEIRFNLMAVVADRQEQLGKQLAAVKARRQAAAAKLGLSDGGDAAAMDVDEPGSSSGAVQQELPSDEEALQHVLAEAEGEIARWVGSAVWRCSAQLCVRREWGGQHIVRKAVDLLSANSCRVPVRLLMEGAQAPVLCALLVHLWLQGLFS